ncbi:MAG: ATP-binding protein [Candidatus Cryptobacteroides sp.]
MDDSFIFDSHVSGKHFIGREQDSNSLANLVAAHENVCIYDAPKTGKTSLIRKALTSLGTSGRRFVVPELDMTGFRSLEQFLTGYVSAILSKTASSPSEYEDIIGRFLPGSAISFDLQEYENTGTGIVCRSGVAEEEAEAVLEFPYVLSKSAGTDMCFVIDEFQNILELPGAERLLKKMEMISQTMRPESPFCHIFCGSGVNAMKWIFAYRKFFFRDIVNLPLSQVSEQDVIGHIVGGFRPSGKVIEKELIHRPYVLFRGNMWYLNMMAFFCGARAIGYINDRIITDAIESVISINTPRFRSIVDSLTGFQLSFLKAVLRGETRFSTLEVIQKYALNSSANVKRVKEALMKKEIITLNDRDEVQVIDPLFEFWFRRDVLNDNVSTGM